MREKVKYLSGTKKILEASQKETEPYYAKVLGQEFFVLPGVFSPKYFHDTEFFAKEIKIKPGEKFLEIGPGSGVISVMVAKQKAKKVTAIDINPEAVRNTKANAILHHVEDVVEVLGGDLFSPLDSKNKFDTIFWNTPFGCTKNNRISTLEKAVFDPNYQATEKFIKDSKKHLKAGGRLLIGFSSTLGHIGKLKSFLKENSFRVKLLSMIESEEIHPVKFELFEAKVIK